MWAFCVCPAWCWIRHPHTSFRPRRAIKTSWLNNFGSTIRVEIKHLCLFSTMSCGGQSFAHCPLLSNIHRVWAHPLALILWCQLLKHVWFGMVRTGPNWTDSSVLWTHSSVLSDTLRRAVSKKKGFAFRYCVGKSSKENLSCTRMSATECWDLASCVRKWRATRSPKSKQSRPKPWHQTHKENQYFGHLCSCTFNQPN